MSTAPEQSPTVAEPPIGHAPTARLDALTSIRFFAALHVVFYHARCTAWASLPAPLERLRDHGDSAVALFYVLSGFILTYTYQGDRGRVEQPKAFWLARVARVWPLYFLGWAICVLQRLHGGGTIRYNLQGFFASALALQAWTPRTLFGWNTPGWSISVEAFFYLCFPLVLPLFGRERRPSRLIAWAVGCWLLGLAALAFGRSMAWDWRLGGFDPWPQVVNYNPLFRLPEFLVGIVAGRLHAVLPRLSGLKADGLVLAGAAISLGVTALWPDLPRDLLHNSLFSLAFAAIVLGLAQGGRAAQWLQAPWLVRLGEASFALYILQEPVMNAWFNWLDEPHSRVHSPWVFGGQLVLLVGASLLAWRWVEGPAQRVIRRIGNRWISPRAGTVAAAAERWPSKPWIAASALGVLAAALLLYRAPEHVAHRSSVVGLALRNAGASEVAYDVVGHEDAFLWQTYEAVPHLRLRAFDSAAGGQPESTWVIAAPNWRAVPVVREPGSARALFRTQRADDSSESVGH